MTPGVGYAVYCFRIDDGKYWRSEVRVCSGMRASWGDITIVLSFCLVIAIIGVAVAGSVNTTLFYVLWALAGLSWVAHMIITFVQEFTDR